MKNLAVFKKGEKIFYFKFKDILFVETDDIENLTKCTIQFKNGIKLDFKISDSKAFDNFIDIWCENN